jgi:2-polyprenyl-6-methoxyphenol hydroxylase-like FAD-dependent oxidoreductase
MLKPAPQQRWPVLIVGAGPVGMLLALLLAGRKIHSLLIEKRPGSLEWSKAIGITPPSLAILAKAGIDRTFITHGVKVTEAVVHDGCGIAGEVRFDRLASAYPFILTLPQSKTLEILAHALEASPYVEVRRSVELVTVSQTGGAVEVGLQATGGGDEKTIQAEWLIGCDGSKSTVRNLLSIGSSRKAYPTRFVMADFGENTRWDRQAHLFFTRQGSLESFPLSAGKRRWVASITKTAEGRTLEQFLVDQTALISGVQLKDPRDSPLFEFQPERLDVSRLYCGRVILAGDAAHVMSPIGWQRPCPACWRMIGWRQGWIAMTRSAGARRGPPRAGQRPGCGWERERVRQPRSSAPRPFADSSSAHPCSNACRRTSPCSRFPMAAKVNHDQLPSQIEPLHPPARRETPVQPGALRRDRTRVWPDERRPLPGAGSTLEASAGGGAPGTRCARLPRSRQR